MDDSATRAMAIATARSLLLREGDNFTVASICRETGLGRATLRRAFPTKAALTTAVLHELLAESELAKRGGDSVPSSRRDSVKVDEPVTETVPAACNLAEGIDASSTQPLETAVEENWIEVRFNVLERAFAALGARVEKRCDDQSNSFALLEQKFEFIKDCSVGPASIAEPPPLIIEQVWVEDSGELEPVSSHERGPAEPPLLESPPSPTANIPVGRSPSRLQLLTIMEAARRSHGDAREWQSGAFGNLRIGLTEMVAAIFAALLTLAALLWAHDRAGATEAPEAPTKRQPQKPASVALIDATGIPKLHPGPTDPGTSDLMARANSGSVNAQTALAETFLRGTGEDHDSLAAARWSLVAAQRGEPSAQFILGTLYFDGIKPDPRLAVKWFFAAASRGNVKAMHNLGVAFLSGQGVARDPAIAVGWFSKAANLGYRDSAFDLAVLYERGEGVVQNPREALRWYDKASSGGDREAAQRAYFLRSNLPSLSKN